jgi:hypothetical protein
VLSSIPDLTASVSVPRLAAIEYPLGYLLGLPGDKEGQRAVLRAVLNALVEMKNPGSVVHLPFSWPASTSVLELEPPEVPPIVKYLLRHPWHIRNFYTREVPSRYQS